MTPQQPQNPNDLHLQPSRTTGAGPDFSNVEGHAETVPARGPGDRDKADFSNYTTDLEELRKKITNILRKHMDVGGELDEEVRSKIKNLEEGTASFEIEYQRVMGELKRKKGLT